jgi:superfamily II DNA or RNA helicase
MKLLNFFGNLFKQSKPSVTTQNIEEQIEETVSQFFDVPFVSTKQPRPHQIEALSILQNHSIGQVCIPTGTGKTFIQLMLHIQDMVEKQKTNEYGVYVIAAHRLVLCNQLFKEFVYETKFNNSFDCDFLSVSSDPYTLKSLHKSMIKNPNVSRKDVALKLSKEDVVVKSTTVKSEIKKFVDNSKDNNKHCVIIATYDSFDRLGDLTSIDVCTYDEAHEITKDDYFSNVEIIKSKIKKQIFFTATRKESDCKRGMNQTGFYGEVLFERSPREMIDAGEIVRPNNFHTIVVKNDEGYDYDNPVMTIRAITEGFKEHKALVKKHSFNPNAIGAKLLVACDGSAQLRDIIFDISFRAWCEDNKIRLFSVNSEDGEWVDFEQVNNRNTFMDKLNELKDTEDAIFLHIKILTEGIDLPAITGIMPIRDMDRTTLTQTLGRATRLLKEDRRRLYLNDADAEKIYPSDYSKFIKPWAWVLVPNYLLDDTNQILSVINDVYDNYGVRADRFSDTEKYMAMSEFPMPSINSDDEINKKFKDGELSHIFTFSEMIELKTQEMTDEEKYNLALNILDNYNA